MYSLSEMFCLIGNQYKAQSFGCWLIFMNVKSHWSGVLGQDEKFDGILCRVLRYHSIHLHKIQLLAGVNLSK